MGRILIVLAFLGTSCGELQDVVNQLPGVTGPSESEIAAGLNEALLLGIDRRVSGLARVDGFYGNPLVSIGLPQELLKVDRAMRDIGLGSLADEGLKVMNRAAEEAVREALPIFVDAVNGLTFREARAILLGDETAATEYLRRTTHLQLYDKFHPVIHRSFEKVGADRIWNTIISRYNNLPVGSDVNPDLTDYVTREALGGVFTVIALEEKEIRTAVSARTTELLRKVFALQDK